MTRLLLLFLLVCGCGTPAAENTDKAASGPAAEVAKMCAIATEVAADSVLDPSQRGLEMAKRWEKEITSPELRKMLATMAQVAPAEKWQVMKKGAAEAGVPDWKCPALEQHFGAEK